MERKNLRDVSLSAVAGDDEKRFDKSSAKSICHKVKCTSCKLTLTPTCHVKREKKFCIECDKVEGESSTPHEKMLDTPSTSTAKSICHKVKCTSCKLTLTPTCHVKREKKFCIECDKVEAESSTPHEKMLDTPSTSTANSSANNVKCTTYKFPLTTSQENMEVDVSSITDENLFDKSSISTAKKKKRNRTSCSSSTTPEEGNLLKKPTTKDILTKTCGKIEPFDKPSNRPVVKKRKLMESDEPSTSCTNGVDKSSTPMSINIKDETLPDNNNVSKDRFAIKTGLNQICKKKLVFDRINEDVLVVSKMFIKTSIFIDFCLRHETNDFLRKKWTSEKPNFLKMTYFFKDKQNHENLEKKEPELYKLFQEFQDLKENDKVLYDSTHRHPLIEEMARDMETNFSNNLREHATSRLKRFFNLLWDLKHNKHSFKKNWNEIPVKSISKKRKQRKKRIKRNRIKRRKWKEKKHNLKKKDQLLDEKERKQIKKRKHINLLARKQRQKVYGRTFSKRKTTKDTTNTKKRDKKKEPSKNHHKRTRKENLLDKKVWVEEQLNKLLLTDLGCSEEEFVRINEDNLDFRRVTSKNDYHKFITFFYKLQQYFVSHNVKSFTLTPVGHLGRKHVKYSNTGLQCLQKAVIQQVHREKYNANKPMEKRRASEVIQKEKSERKERAEAKRKIEKEKKKLLEKKRALLNKKENLYKEKKFKKKDKNFAEKTQNEIDKVQIELKNITDEMKSLTDKKDAIYADINKENKESNDSMWKEYFDFKKIFKKVRARGATFSNYITTNGIDVSIIFNRRKNYNYLDDHNLFQFTKFEGNDKGCKYDIYKGCDPGLNLAFAGVERRDNPKPQNLKQFKGKKGERRQDLPFRIKSSTFRWQTQEQKRQSFLYKKERNYRHDFYKVLNAKYGGEVNGNDPSQVQRVTRYRLEAFSKMQSFRERRNIARLSWDKYMNRQRETDFLANFLINQNEGKSQLLVMGQPMISPVMKGHRRMALRLVVRRIIERSRLLGSKKLRVIFVNEHNSTQMCSTCNEQMSVRRNRTAYCGKCGVTWNRDVNAGRNILNIGLILLKVITRDSIPHPEVFNALKQKEK